MVKILSQAGNSLADVYDVEGSVAGIETLESRELPIVHEMGSTVFSERFSGFIRRIATGPIIQNTAFDATISGLPEISRVLGVLVLADVVARTDLAQVSIRSVTGGREMPIMIFDVNDGFSVEAGIRIVENNGVASTQQALIGRQQLPSISLGIRQPQSTEEIVLRGVTSGFGAGNVNYVLLAYVVFADIGGISSRGLPIPSW